MKAVIRFMFFSMTVAALASAAVMAQKKTDDRARGLFVSKRADAMQIVILKADGERLVPADPSQEFKAGDQIKVAFQSNFDGYVYIVNIAPSGKKCVLFPQGNEAVNAISPNKRYELPMGREVIKFDEEQGTEVLQVIMTRERVAYLDEAAKNPEGCLADSASSAAAELAQGGIVTKGISPVVPKNGPGGIRARDIIFAAGKDNDSEGTVVAIPDNKGSNAKLKTGEAAIFEIRLKHK